MSLAEEEGERQQREEGGMGKCSGEEWSRRG